MLRSLGHWMFKYVPLPRCMARHLDGMISGISNLSRESLSRDRHCAPRDTLVSRDWRVMPQVATKLPSRKFR